MLGVLYNNHSMPDQVLHVHAFKLQCTVLDCVGLVAYKLESMSTTSTGTLLTL